MDVRLTTTDVAWRLVVATMVALALLMALGATSASAATPTARRVQDIITGRTTRSSRLRSMPPAGVTA